MSSLFVLPIEVMESSDDYKLTALCLRAFKKAIRIAGGLDLAVSNMMLRREGDMGGACVFKYNINSS